MLKNESLLRPFGPLVIRQASVVLFNVFLAAHFPDVNLPLHLGHVHLKALAVGETRCIWHQHHLIQIESLADKLSVSKAIR
jgi:hypothetical protein